MYNVNTVKPLPGESKMVRYLGGGGGGGDGILGAGIRGFYKNGGKNGCTVFGGTR